MRILYASERPPYPFFLGGAARCAHRLLHALACELHVECSAVGSNEYRTTPWSYPDPSDHAALGVLGIERSQHDGSIDCGYPCRVIADFAQGLDELIEAQRPDIVWAQLEGAKLVLESARRKGVVGLLFVHDAEFDPVELRAIGALGCHVVCSSAFLAKKASKVIGRKAHVVYPCPETDFGVAGDAQGHITMINPHRVKGIDTFFEIAKRMPSERFLLVESWRLPEQALKDLNERLTGASNVRFVRRVSDMQPIYGQTRLLLVPSVWEEGFGMVAVEAQSCGIPVIASARGGLPESVGDGGLLIDDYLDAEAWVEAIGRVLGDPTRYAAFATKASQHAAAEKFSVAYSARRFKDVCASKAPAMGALSRRIGDLLHRVGGLRDVRGLVRRARR